MDYIYLLCIEGYEYTQIFGMFNSIEDLYKSYKDLMENDHRCKEDTKTDKPHIYRLPLNSFIGIKQEYGENWCEYYDDIDSLEVSLDELKEEIHKEIVKKLGFEPKDYIEIEPKGGWHEDDSKPKENICMSGHDLTEVYIGKDRRRLLYKALKAANKELTYKDVILMGAVYGHSSLVKNDFDSIYYSGYVIWLILHKKYKYLCDRDILKAFCNMQFMNMRIPKGIRRKVKRIIRKCEKEQPWWYKGV